MDLIKVSELCVILVDLNIGVLFYSVDEVGISIFGDDMIL